MKGERLFIGVQPSGIVYCDRAETVDGDYRRIAFLPFRSLEPRFEDGCPDDLRDRVQSSMDAVISRRGEPYPVSTSGQTVMLGG